MVGWILIKKNKINKCDVKSRVYSNRKPQDSREKVCAPLLFRQ